MNGEPTTAVAITAAVQPDVAASTEEWVGWFWHAFLPAWIDRARDRECGGFFDALDGAGKPVQEAPKTVLAQARLLYTFAHLALHSPDAIYRNAAHVAHGFLSRFRKADGLYCRAVTRDGRPTGKAADAVARSYDQSFVILALATWSKLVPDHDIERAMETCWQAIETTLTDTATGLLLEDDSIGEPSALSAPPRAQNPHMHLFEAALQAFETTGHDRWLERAQTIRNIATNHFFDPETGTVFEFLAPDMSVLPGSAGARREVGHQCEWAWLLHKEADLGGDAGVRTMADRLSEFALRHGFADRGVMSGAAFDAVASDGSWREETFLLWPQTEAVKAYVTRVRNGDVVAGKAAQILTSLIFTRYFAGRPAFANQLDAEGSVLWPDALSRLLYHLVLALTEGAGAGLWPGPTRKQKGGE